MAESYDHMQGKEQDVAVHPDSNTESPRLSDMVLRGRSLVDYDRDQSTRAAFKAGMYDENGTYNKDRGK